MVKFSPDGKQILLIRNAGKGEEAWLLPYSANASNPPHRILLDLPAVGGTPAFSWMPDNRRVVLSTTPGGAPPQLHMADTVSGACPCTESCGRRASPDRFRAWRASSAVWVVHNARYHDEEG